MRTIAIINQKGGCGKTTTAINLSGLLARAGSRVLLVDMDPQSHCAAGLGVPENRLDMDVSDALVAVGTRPLDPQRLFWRFGNNLTLAPSRMRLAGLESPKGRLAEAPDRDRRLLKILGEFQSSFDTAIIDCSPAIGLLTFNALTAASVVIIPVETSFFSLQGATRQFNTVKTMARKLGISVPVWVLPTIHDDSNAVAHELLVELQRRFKDRLCPVTIRRDSRLKEAASAGTTIYDYAPNSTGAEDYSNLAAWTASMLVSISPKTIDVSHADPLTMIDPSMVEVLPTGPETDGSEDFFLPTDPSVGTQGYVSRAQPYRHADIPVAPAATMPFQTDVRPPAGRPGNRAEDVARRAHQFFNRFAGQAGPPSPAPPAALAPVESPGQRDTDSASAQMANIARSLLGVRVTRQGVLFAQPLDAANHIAVAGDFNNWSPTSHPMLKNRTLNIFELCIPLPPGTTRYRLVIDGVWSSDPYNTLTEENSGEERNNVVVVTSLAEQGRTPETRRHA